MSLTVIWLLVILFPHGHAPNPIAYPSEVACTEAKEQIIKQTGMKGIACIKGYFNER